MSKSVILNEGLLKHTINTYSSGGYTLLIRNNKSGDMESIPFSSVSPDLAGYPTLDGTQTFTGLNTFNQATTFANGISIVGGSYAVAATAPTLTASRSIIYPDASGTIALTSDLTAYVPKTRNITINGTTYDLSADRTWTIVSMIYPSAGIAVSTGTAWGTSITDNSTNWNTAYTNRITSLTTTGSSGAATLTSNTLNIPNYTLSGLGGQAALNGTGFVKASGTTISYDNSTYLTGITSGQVTTALGYTPYNSTNPNGYITSSITSTFTINRGDPTIYLQDTDHRSSMIHCNSNIFYVLRGNGTNSTTWATYNGYWPLELNLENNNATFGGSITAIYDITAYSDRRVKENISTLKNSLDKVLSMRGVTYQRIDRVDDKDKYDIGVIAQEIQEIAPELVSENDKGHLNVAYGNFAGLFIESFKEHNRIIKTQQEQIDDLYRQIQFLVENR